MARVLDVPQSVKVAQSESYLGPILGDYVHYGIPSVLEVVGVPPVPLPAINYITKDHHEVSPIETCGVWLDKSHIVIVLHGRVYEVKCLLIGCIV